MKNCGVDDCFNCPYKDCILAENGKVLKRYIKDVKKPTERKKPVKQESTEEKRAQMREYQKKYFQENRDRILSERKSRYRYDDAYRERIRELQRSYYHKRKATS